MSIAIGFMNDDEYPGIHFSDEEKRGLPNADAFLAILIPAAAECYKRWDPVNARMSWQTFYTYFSHNVDFATKVYQSQRQGHEFDFSILNETAVPHIKDTAPILAAVIEQCRGIWTTADAPHGPFISVVIHYLYIIANKMYHAGMKAAGLMNNSDRDIDIIDAGKPRKISFSEEEKSSLPDSDAALHILIAAARQCYRFLNPATSGIDEQTCWTHYVHSNNCAFQVIQRIDRLGAVNLDALCAKIDIPHIEDTLPILVTAYEKCRAIWTDIYTGYVIGSHMILDDIGEKMYPGGLGSGSSLQFRDIFADTAGHSFMCGLHSSGTIGFPKSDEIMPVIRPATAECYAIWDPKNVGMPIETLCMHFQHSLSAVWAALGESEADSHDHSATNIPHFADVKPILSKMLQKARTIWASPDCSDREFLDRVTAFVLLVAAMRYTGKSSDA